MENRTITLKVARLLYHGHDYGDLTVVSHPDESFGGNVYLKNDHDEYFYFTIERVISSYILYIGNRNYPAIYWNSDNTDAPVELFPCSKEDLIGKQII